MLILTATIAGCQTSFAPPWPDDGLPDVPLFPESPNPRTPPPELDPAKPLDLSTLIDLFRANNPDLAAAARRYQAARFRPEQEATPDNPMIEFMPEFAGRAGFVKNGTLLTQTIPFPGKLRLRGEIAQQEAIARKEDFHTLANNMTAELKRLYFELALADRRIAVTRTNIALLKDFEGIAQTKYATGTATQQDVLKAQVEWDKLTNDLVVLERDRAVAVAALNTLLDLPPATPLGKPAEIGQPPQPRPLDDLLRQAAADRPELRQAHAEIVGSQRAVDLAHRQYYPDFTIGAQYFRFGEEMEEGDRDSYGPVVGLSIPLYRQKLNAALRESEESLAAARFAARATENAVLNEVTAAHASLAAASKLIASYQGTILPRARQMLDNARTGYQTGTVSFLDLIDSQRTLLMLSLEYEEHRFEYHRVFAELQRATGEIE